MDRSNDREKMHSLINEPTKQGLTPEQEAKAVNVNVEACDDNFIIYIEKKDGIITEARFDGVGCSISRAAMEAVCRNIDKLKVKDTTNLLNKYEELINGKINKMDNNDLDVFAIIKDHKSRRKCALAPINAIREEIK